MTKIIVSKNAFLNFYFKYGHLTGLRLGAVVLILLVGCSGKKSDSVITPISGDHPNVLLIIVDDLKPMLNAYGESQIITPNIDSLAEESAVFTNAHCQQAVCSPSRISFLTGMRPDYTQIWGLKTLMVETVPDILTLPKHFKMNGYETIGLGKVFHNGEDNKSDYWTKPFIKRKGLEYSKDYPEPFYHAKYQNAKFREVYDRNSWHDSDIIKKAMEEAGALPSVEHEDVADDSYMDGAITLKAIEYLKGLDGNSPFFLTVGFRKPHLPFVAPQRYWDLYEDENIELASFREKAEGSPDLAYHRSIEMWAYSDINSNFEPNGYVDDDKQRELIHGYYACVSYIDAQVGLLRNYLKESGLDKNTVVILMSDHGWHLGDHGLWCKHSNYEQATRTPLIIHTPEMKGRLTNASPVELLDVFPTLSDLAGLEMPEHLQGKSLVPILNSEVDSVKSFAMSQYPRGSYMGYALRTNRYRYIEWHKKEPAVKGIYSEENILATELYDYEVDPLETKNLTDEKEYVQVRVNLKEMLKGSFAENRNLIRN